MALAGTEMDTQVLVFVGSYGNLSLTRKSFSDKIMCGKVCKDTGQKLNRYRPADGRVEML